MSRSPVPVTPAPLAARAGHDAEVVRLWLHGRPATTRQAYGGDVDRFLAFRGQSLAEATLGDLRAYADSLVAPAPATRARPLSAVESLLAFGHRIGVLPVDAGAALRRPKLRDRLTERILAEPAVQRVLALEPDPRNRALLRLAHAGGFRVSEPVALCWRDLQPRADAGRATVFGKGGNTRTVLLIADPWLEVVALRGSAEPDDPVFRSRQGGHLDPRRVRRVEVAAGRRAGLDAHVGPNGLRHAHAAHALERGAPVHPVAATLGRVSIATTGRYAYAHPTDPSSRDPGV